jgi:hypothetical protein
MNHSIKNGLFIFILSVITAGLFVMANPVNNIFAIEGEEKNTDIKSTTDSSHPNSNKKEGCSPLDPRC